MSDTARESAEAAILGIVMLAEPALGILIEEGLRPEHFWTAWRGEVFAAMRGLADNGHHVDRVTLCAKFAGHDTISAGHIEMLAASAGNPTSLRDYCRIVREGAWFDDAAQVLFDAGQALAHQDRTAILAALRRLDESGDVEPEQDAASAFLAWYDAEQRGWAYPFPKVTDATGGGMRPGEVTVLGAWSGFGKTILESMMLSGAAAAGARCHEYANEMFGPQRTSRILSTLTGIPTTRIDRKRLNPAETGRVMKALGSLPYTMDNSAGWSVEEYCRRMRRDKWDVAAIDTVANLPCGRVDEWDRACTMLADTAAQTGTHLILVCQLNLERDKGKRPPPVGRDLRNTGLWYHRARCVMFVHRNQEAQESGDGSIIWQPAAEGHVRVDKASHGDPTLGYVPVVFNARWMRFDQADDDGPSRRHLEAV